MKLLSADIVNFKSLGHLPLDFQSSSGAVRNLTCLVGDNGAGKTTVLQAIAFVLSLATRRTRFADAFDWHGFLAERIGSMGRTRVELQIALTDAEVALTSWKAGVEQLRQFLVGWWGYHTSPVRAGGKDYIPELQEKFCAVFPDRRFVGLAPKESSGPFGANDFYFLLEAQGRTCDLAEMSSGEQAVFPLVYEFVRLDISNAIVLIDELELHLHPPEQQRLLASLPRLGASCQFVISTHSPYLTDAIPNEHEIRLEGGSRCL